MPATQSNVITGPDETALITSPAGHAYNAEAYDNFIPAVRTPITAGSGGTQLQSWPGGKLIIRNASGNGLMFMGGIGQHAPFSGRGLSIYGNETVTIPIKSADRISIMSTVSGQFIEYGMFITAPTSDINVDLSGIYITPDTTAPTIQSNSPTDNASGVITTFEISATFSEEMASGTIDTSSFVVKLSGSATPLSGTVTLDDTLMITTFTPVSGQVVVSEVYNAYLATSITDLAGNPLAASGQWNWTTQAAPFIVSTSPLSGASGVATDSDIYAIMSQPMDETTVTTARYTVRLSGSSTNISGVVLVDSQVPEQIQFIPYSGLIAVSGGYTARLATTIADIYGNPLAVSGAWGWTTAAGPPPPDTTPPRVSGTTPTSGATNVSGTRNITVQFSEQVQSGTVNTTNLFVKLSGQSAVSAAVSLDASLKTGTINPTAALLNGKTYLIQVLSGVRDLAGNFLSPYLSGKQFTTIPLFVSGTNPVSGATDIDVSTNIIVTFSQPMASGSINSTNLYIQLSGTKISASVTLSGNLKAAQINPTTNLGHLKKYFLYVTSGATDVNGNFLDNIVSGVSFTTEEPNWNIPYTVTAFDDSHTLDSDKFRVGEKMTASAPYPLSGKNIQKVTVYLKKDGSPASNGSGVSIHMRKADGTIAGVFGYQNPSTLANSFTEYTYVNGDITYEMQHNDIIEVQYLSGTATDNIKVNTTESAVFTGGELKTYNGSTYSGASYVDTGDELRGTFYSTN